MDEIQLLQAFRDRPEPDRAAVLKAAAAAAAPPARGRRPTIRRLVPAVALFSTVAVAIVVGFVVGTGSDERGVGVDNAQASEILRTAAALPLSGPERPLRKGEYWYVKRRTRYVFEAGDRYRFIQPTIREDWVGPDGSRRWRTAPSGRPIFPTPGDRARWREGGRLMGGLGKPSEHQIAPPRGPFFYLGNEDYSYGQLVKLPRDSTALYQVLHRAAADCDCGPSVNAETFVMVGDLLRDPPLPRDLRAALLRAAARIPGITLVQNAHDLSGRPGIGVSYGDGQRASMLVFDRRTRAFLGESEGEGQGSVDLASGIVSSLHERP